jgi:hypothetical protein
MITWKCFLPFSLCLLIIIPPVFSLLS